MYAPYKKYRVKTQLAANMSKRYNSFLFVSVIPLPTISPSTSSYTVTIGGELPKIKCTEACWPSCDVIWIGPDKIVVNSENLKLANIQKRHSGQYRCLVRNVVGSNNTQLITVKVQCKLSIY